MLSRPRAFDNPPVDAGRVVGAGRTSVNRVRVERGIEP